MTENLIICALFVVSGLIILSCLKRFHMNTAYYVFIAFYCLMLLYIPFYFGGRLALRLVSYSYNESNYLIFVYRMEKTLSAPFPYIESISLLTALGAIFALLGALILTIIAAIAVIKFVKNINRKNGCQKSVLPGVERAFDFERFFCGREKYLEYCKLLN